jgi:hypothetical protein
MQMYVVAFVDYEVPKVREVKVMMRSEDEYCYAVISGEEMHPASSVDDYFWLAVRSRSRRFRIFSSNSLLLTLCTVQSLL